MNQSTNEPAFAVTGLTADQQPNHQSLQPPASLDHRAIRKSDMNASSDSPITVTGPALADTMRPDASPVESRRNEFVRAQIALAREIDGLSLKQALLDFELANVRVLDLTARLVEANNRVIANQATADASQSKLDSAAAELSSAHAEIDRLNAQLLEARQDAIHRTVGADAARSETEALRSHLLATQAEMKELRNSPTFRIVQKIGSLKRMIRR
jgi:hypothetical protein